MLGKRPLFALENTGVREQKNGSELDGSELNLNELAGLPDDILLELNEYLPSVKDKAHLVRVNRRFRGFFKPEIEKSAAKASAACAINPTKENVEELKIWLNKCPALLSQVTTVKNRHGMEIKGTVYQIALHEIDNELIEDVIQPVFERLQDGLAMMEAQRQEWLHHGWVDAEEKICRRACEAIDHLFAAFRGASNANDVTGLLQSPYTITINHQGAKEALEACKRLIAALYQPTVKIISGRDPIIRLLERVSDRFEENYVDLGGYDSPRNNAIKREVFGYCQRFAPINFMQAFAMGVYYIVKNKEKLVRSFEYRNWCGNFILPLDSDPLFRLGYEYFCALGAAGVRGGCSARAAWAIDLSVINFFVNQKQQHFINLELCNFGNGIAQ